jgi:hypothetical protein
MSKQELYKTSEQMKLREDKEYLKALQATRRLLIKHKAQDLLPMLGLENDNNNEA